MKRFKRGIFALLLLAGIGLVVSKKYRTQLASHQETAAQAPAAVPAV